MPPIVTEKIIMNSVESECKSGVNGYQKCRDRIWVGSYKTAEQAARGYDVAVYCLCGPTAKFNFPNSVPVIPSASSLSRHHIQLAAAKYALNGIPPNNDNVLTSTNDSHLISEELDLALWDPLLGDFDGNDIFNLEEFPTLEVTSAREEHGLVFFDLSQLRSF